jgi:DNA-binding NarL/FixJ family response regulator
MAALAPRGNTGIHIARIELSHALADLRCTRKILSQTMLDVHRALGKNAELRTGLRLNAIPSPDPSQPKLQGSLTPRQIEIVVLICKGLQIKEMAWKLGISPKTVEYHRQQVSERLGLTTTASVVRYAIRAGLINP